MRGKATQIQTLPLSAEERARGTDPRAMTCRDCGQLRWIKEFRQYGPKGYRQQRCYYCERGYRIWLQHRAEKGTVLDWISEPGLLIWSNGSDDRRYTSCWLLRN